MNEFKSLQFLDYFARIFLKWGIDYPMMREMVKIKLIMDQRSVPTIFQQNNKKKDGNFFIKSLWLYAHYGLVLIPFLLIEENYIFSMSIFIGISMFLVMTSMISDFSTVLLDLRDKHILGTKPITHRTISAAKFIHISFYMFFLTTAITLIPIAVGIIKHGVIFGFILIIELFLMNLFILVLTAFMYLAILRFFDGERLKDMINYIQILLSVALFVGYQMVIRSFDLVDIDIHYRFQVWHFFLPPFWFAAVYEFILNGHREYYFIIFSLMAVFIPLVSFMMYIKLMPVFEQNLEKLSSHSVGKKKRRVSISSWFANIVTTVKQEKVIYHFAIKMMKTEREFKLKVYPPLVFSIFFPFLFLFNELRYTSFDEVVNSRYYFNIYFSLLAIPSVISMLRYSGNYKGSWIFYALPIQDEAVIHKGTLKAFLMSLFLPIYLVLATIFTILFSVSIIPDLLIVLFVALLYTVVCFKVLNKREYPFSEPFEVAGQSEGVKVFLLFVLIAAFAGIHFMVGSFQYGKYMYIIVLFLLNLLGWKIGFKRNKVQPT
ncbi:hypothetical protein FZW96_17380 [Bacillus sp. BGMRC 2118]|nr:hypothetical protein FZW96_17380 [Bacillus sp. BGMRC 2118]